MHKIPELKSKPDLDLTHDLASVTEQCERLFKETTQRIEKAYVDGALEWIEENNQDLNSKIKAAEEKLNDIWRRNVAGKGSISDFKQALKCYFEANMRAIERYKRHLMSKK